VTREAVLHGYFRSSAAYRVRIALNLKGLPVRHVFHHLRKGEQRGEDYLALNPSGLVPTFVAEDGTAIGQSVAIIEYLDETHPEPPLLPRDAAGRARVRELALDIACDVHPINNLRVLNRLRSQFGADDAGVEAWARHWSTLAFQALEGKLAASPSTGAFCHGDAPGLADICLIPQFFNALRFKVDMAPFPTIRRIADACQALPAFRNARPEAQPDAE